MTANPEGYMPVTPEVTEASWVYLCGSQPPGRTEALLSRLAATCEDLGWAVYRSPQASDTTEAASTALPSRLQEAVNEADAVVAYVGQSSPMTATELAAACRRGRPIVALTLSSEEPSSQISSILANYDRARLLTCAEAGQCADALRQTLSERKWRELIADAVATGAEEP